MYAQIKSKKNHASVVGGRAAKPSTSISKESFSKESLSPIQLEQIYGGDNTLYGSDGTAHWHYVFLDDNTNSLHITLADNRTPNQRTWECRRTYTPTSRTAGVWSGWVTRFGHPPQWAKDLAGDGGTQEASEAFHADDDIRALLALRFPVAPVVLNDNDFPALGAV